MPDITCCTGLGCPKKASCYRATATWNECRQSVFVEPPLDVLTEECLYFWDNSARTTR